MANKNVVLYHHGIKGQKWGVRRYQNKDGSLTSKGKERYLDRKTGMSMYAGMLPKQGHFSMLYNEDSLQERIENPDAPGSKNWLFPEHSRIREERYRQEYIDDPDSVFDKCISKINTTNGDEIGTTNNCTKVASAMILAKKGYDYDAGRSHGGYAESLDYWFDNAKKSVYDNLDTAISQEFDTMDNGRYGTVNLRNNNGGGHVFNWEKNSKGEFALYEGQSKNGEKYTGSSIKEAFDRYTEQRPWFKNDGTVRIHDMTDAEPNWNHMAEDSVLRITDGSYTSALYDTVTKRDYTGY